MYSNCIVAKKTWQNCPKKYRIPGQLWGEWEIYWELSCWQIWLQFDVRFSISNDIWAILFFCRCKILALSYFSPIFVSIGIIFWHCPILMSVRVTFRKLFILWTKNGCRRPWLTNTRHHTYIKHIRKDVFSYSLSAKNIPL